MIQFQPPSWDKPRDYSFIPQTLDAIFGAYARAKAMRQQEQNQRLNMMLGQGVDPMSQESINQGLARAQMVRDLQMMRAQQQADMAPQREALELEKLRADIARANAEAERLSRPEQEKPIAGYRPTPEGGLKPIPGGPADIKEQVRQQKMADAQEAMNRSSQAAIDAGNKALPLIGKSTAGFGAMLKSVPSTDAKTLAGYIDTLKSSLSLDRLQEMRRNSPTGGAMGQTSDRDLQLLADSAGSLDQSQDPKILKENIINVIDTFKSMQTGKPLPKKQTGSPLDDILKKHNL